MRTTGEQMNLEHVVIYFCSSCSFFAFLGKSEALHFLFQLLCTELLFWSSSIQRNDHQLLLVLFTMTTRWASSSPPRHCHGIIMSSAHSPLIWCDHINWSQSLLESSASSSASPEDNDQRQSLPLREDSKLGIIKLFAVWSRLSMKWIVWHFRKFPQPGNTMNQLHFTCRLRSAVAAADGSLSLSIPF